MVVVAAALMQDYHVVSFIGEEAGDVLALHASRFSYDLPRPGITVKLPTGYSIRPNGEEMLKGLQLADRDEILEGLLKQPDKTSR